MKSNLLVAGEYEYFLHECIGKGAWGSVFKARDSQGNLVALKKMNKFQIEATQDSYQKLEAQIESLQRVMDCGNIIKFIDVFKTENYYYIVTEYFEGSEDLLKFMERRKTFFPELEAVKLWRQIVSGVQFLHANDIVHRDLKPQNLIYIEETKELKIIDFGLALTLESHQVANTLVGSPLFISPQVLHKQKYTSKCDIWSLGIIFYYTLFGESPYGSIKSLKEIQTCMQKIKEGHFELPSRMLSDEIKELVLLCLQYEEEDRPSAAQILSLPIFKDTSYVKALNKLPKVTLAPLIN